ncbi:hypothetical protein [Parafrankia discariae]|uniref:hypothetical protein n=1 Tax=Parafrankia discariae TaxID=365528 RepID=UPI00037E7B17|nr:hypothetical protein [Parafrankia discariae]
MHGSIPSTPSAHEIPHSATEHRGVDTSPKQASALPLAALQPSDNDLAQAQRICAPHDTPAAVQHAAGTYISVRAEMLAEELDGDAVDLIARLVREMAAGARVARARLIELRGSA